MANATDFIGSVYDTLAKTFNTGNTSSNVFLQMAWPGYSLSPADFKPASAPNGPYNPNVAEKTFSDLSNIAPTDDKLSFENSGFLIDELYDILLQSAAPMGTTSDTVVNNPLFKLFSDAQFDLLSAQKGSVDDPNEFYHKCDATPNNWYDENAAKTWPTINIKSTDVQPAAPTSAFTRLGGAALISKGLLRLKPDPASKPLIISGLQNVLVQKTTKVNTTFKLNTVAAIKPVPRFAAIAGKAPVATVVKSPALSSKLTADRAKIIFTQKLTPVSTFPALKSTLATIDLSKTFAANKPKTGTIAQDYVIRNLVSLQLPAKPVSPTTTGFSISFRYCRVNISRPWLDLSLLSMPNWYIPFTPKGQYSTGTADNNPGMFPFLPTSFIVIRDLKITANWSQDDKANLANSTSFGPFDTSSGSFNQDTFEASGLQIIAWISKLMPPLAPAESNP